ncbi:MAG: hypothetical protein WBW62_11625 [Solirubrobacterales bacterium]
MAKKKNRRKRPPKLKAPNSSYTDADGNVLVLRQALSAGTLRQMRSEMVSDAFTVDDMWQRRTELLFERLTVSWEISGLPLDDQAMLLGRYRMADSTEKNWVRETIDRHINEYFPDLAS